MVNIEDIEQWFAVRVRTRLGSLVSQLLHAEGIEVFLPLYKSRRQWSDRMKAVEVPLFPGYLFSKFAWNCRRSVIMTTGVIEIVGFGSVQRRSIPAKSSRSE